MKERFKKRIESGRFYLDGGFGSRLIAMGKNAACNELLNIEDEDTVLSIHRQYFAAGSHAVYTNTFGANREKADISRYSLKDIITAGVRLARTAAGEERYVIYSAGPTGRLLQPYGNLAFEDAYALYREQADCIRTLDVDAVAVETLTDLNELRAAVLAFSEGTEFPILCSMSFEEGDRTFTGAYIDSFLLTARALQVAAVGLNCGTGPDRMRENVERLLIGGLPVFVKPNAGLPVFRNGRTEYPMQPEEFAAHMEVLAGCGAGILGGCCGTDVRHIKQMIACTKDIALPPQKKGRQGVCSYAKVLPERDTPLIIGERVNPTGKPLLKQALSDGDYDYILSLCVEQLSLGADALDINVGMAGIDETAVLKETVLYVQGTADLPLVIDTARPLAAAAALRVAAGVPILNSVNGKKQSMQEMFPLAKRYGAYLIALCLDENGIPNTAEARVEIARHILAEGERYGIERERFFFDPLTMAVSVQENNAAVTLDTVRLLQQELGVKTILGLSNVSFGLPNRDKINAMFYQMAIDCGVSAVIVNPALAPKYDEAAHRLLLGEDRRAERYIAENTASENAQIRTEHTLKECIVRGLRGEAERTVRALADEGNFTALIDAEIIGGLNFLGERFERREVFLPQLIAASEAAKGCLEYLREQFLSKESPVYKAVIVLATVEGDVHDIGKNILKAVVGNYGYRIIDLGKDVPLNRLLDAVAEHRPNVVALSALMTTTLDNMTEAVRAIRAYDEGIIVMVGGAVVTKEYADGLCAVYSKDANGAVRELERIFER